MSTSFINFHFKRLKNSDINYSDSSITNYLIFVSEIPYNSEYVIRDKEQQIIDSSQTLYDAGIKNGETLFIGTKGTVT